MAKSAGISRAGVSGIIGIFRPALTGYRAGNNRPHFYSIIGDPKLIAKWASSSPASYETSDANEIEGRNDIIAAARPGQYIIIGRRRNREGISTCLIPLVEHEMPDWRLRALPPAAGPGMASCNLVCAARGAPERSRQRASACAKRRRRRRAWASMPIKTPRDISMKSARKMLRRQQNLLELRRGHFGIKLFRHTGSSIRRGPHIISWRAK